MNESLSASVLTSWAQMVLDALRALGIDPQPVLSEAGLSEESFQDPSARLSGAATALLWRKAAEHAGDPAFGLKVPKYMRLTAFHALGYSVIASVTLGEAMERAFRFGALISNGGCLTLEVMGERAAIRLQLRADADGCCDELRDAILSSCVRSFRLLTRRAFVLDEVELRRSAHTDLTPYRRFFDCAVTLGRDDVLWFRSELLTLPLATANPQLANANDAVAREYLATMAHGSIVDRVRAALDKQLQGKLSPHVIARLLGMSVRSLQRALAEQGTSFGEVLQSLRYDLARAYLQEQRHSLTEIATLLGYRSLSAFTRAFKGWSGSPPTGYASPRRGSKDAAQ